jgi:hypothetical protein
MTEIQSSDEDVRTTICLSREGGETSLLIQLEERWVSGIDSRHEVISTRLPQKEMILLRDMISAALEEQPEPGTPG